MKRDIFFDVIMHFAVLWIVVFMFVVLFLVIQEARYDKCFEKLHDAAFCYTYVQ